MKIMACAGETSGDMYGAALVRELKALAGPGTEFFGTGGDAMRAEGVELFAHVSQTGVIGIWEVARRFGFFSRLFRSLRGLLASRRPDLLVTIDYPGMNLRLAAAAKALGIPVAHWVCPQVWAWRKGRIPKIAAALDRLMCFFPFEPALFEGTGLDTVFTGHPLVDEIGNFEKTAPSLAPLPWGEGHRLVLMCGSRPGEVRRILPDLLAGAAEAEKTLGPCSFLLPAPDATRAAQMEEALKASVKKPKSAQVVVGRSRQAMLEARAAIVKSGTSTLEAALLGTPHSLAYRVAPLSYAVLSRLVTGVRWIGLPNIVAGRGVVPERIQGGLSPQTVRDDLVRLCSDAAARDAQISAFGAIRRTLGGGGAAARAASAALAIV